MRALIVDGTPLYDTQFVATLRHDDSHGIVRFTEMRDVDDPRFSVWITGNVGVGSYTPDFIERRHAPVDAECCA